MFELRRWAAAGVVTLLAGVLAPAGNGVAEAQTRPEHSHEVEVTDLTFPGLDGVSKNLLMNERGEVVLHPIDTGDAFHWKDREVTRINPEDTPATAKAISAKGQVVGNADGQPFSWVKGRWEILPLGDASSGDALDVNDRGTVAGIISTDDGDKSFVAWKRGELIRAPEEIEVGSFFPALIPRVFVNNRNQVAISTLVPGSNRNVIWDIDTGAVTDLGTLGGAYTAINAFNDRGMATGFGLNADRDSRAFLWKDGEMTNLGTLGGDSSTGADLNERGEVTGTSDTADGNNRAFLWDEGEMTNLGTLGGDDSRAGSINNRGHVVGYSTTSGHYGHATLWKDGEVVDLGEAAEPLARSWGDDINDRGQIVGYTERDFIVVDGVMWTVKERRH